MKYCYKCGSELLDEAMFCPKCGCQQPSVNRNDSTIYSTEKASSNTNSKDFSSLDPYYQERFQMFLNNNEQDTISWNWWAFLFGPLWGLTKGLWLSAIIAVLATILTSGIGGVVYWFIYGLRGNYMYYCKYTRGEQKAV